MTRQALFDLLIGSRQAGNIPEITSLAIENNELAKQFAVSEAKQPSTAFKQSLTAHPDMYNFFVKTNLYKRNTGFFTFVNELSFAQQLNFYIERVLTPYVVGCPDCIDKNMITGDLQGWELTNHYGRQYLPEPKFNIRYDILINYENFDYYRSRHPTCRLRTYNDLKLHDPFRYTQINSQYQNIVPRMKEFNTLHAIKFGKFKL